MLLKFWRAGERIRLGTPKLPRQNNSNYYTMSESRQFSDLYISFKFKNRLVSSLFSVCWRTECPWKIKLTSISVVNRNINILKITTFHLLGFYCLLQQLDKLYWFCFISDRLFKEARLVRVQLPLNCILSKQMNTNNEQFIFCTAYILTLETDFDFCLN